MRFRFRLEQVLRLVVLDEKRKKQEIVKTLGHMSSLRNKMAMLETNIRGLLRLTTGDSPEMAWSCYQSEKIIHDRDAIVIAKLNLADIKEALQNMRRELAAIQMKRKALEKKKDADRREFTLVQNRREQRRMDDNHRILSKTEEADA